MKTAIVNHATEDSIRQIKELIVQFRIPYPKMDLMILKDVDFIVPSRKAELVLARHLLIKFLKDYTLASLDWIGNVVGGKDHCTVIYAGNAINNYIDTIKPFKVEYERIGLQVVDILNDQVRKESDYSYLLSSGSF